MTKTNLFFIAALASLILSFILLTLPGSDFPSENWFDKIYLDKWIHIAMFGGMVWLWCRYWHLLKLRNTFYSFRKAFITIGFIFLTYGIVMEFVQKFFTTSRSFDLTDMLADGTGCALGVLFSIRMYLKK